MPPILRDLAFSIECTSVAGHRRTFKCRFTIDPFCGRRLLGFVFPSESQDGDFFSINLLHEGGRVRIEAISRNNPAFGAQGIPDSVIPELAKRLQIPIFSSLPAGEGRDGDSRSSCSDKMWKRLLKKGIAEGDLQQGRLVVRHPGFND